MKTPYSFALAALALASTSFAQPAATDGSQTPPPPQPASPGYHETAPRLDPNAIAHSDRKFLQTAAASGMKEVVVSDAVLPRLQTAGARDLARTMVKAHTAANEELSRLAGRKAVNLPVPDEKLAKKWAEKTENLDEDYIKEMIADHKDAIALFEEAEKSKDADIAAFATKTLPELRHHLDMAKGGKPTRQH